MILYEKEHKNILRNEGLSLKEKVCKRKKRGLRLTEKVDKGDNRDVRTKRNVDKKERRRVSRWIYAHLPGTVRDRWTRYLEKSFRNRTANSRENKQALMEFQLRQISIICTGILSLSLLLTGLLIYTLRTSQYSYTRSSFGQGEQQLILEVEQGDEKEEVTLVLEEEELDPEEEEAIFQNFFAELAQHMKGENSSLSEVNKALDFSDQLSGYPFTISYEPEDVSWIQWSGELGESAMKLKAGESKETGILVQASYKTYSREKRIGISCIAQEQEVLSLTDRFREYLEKREESTRDQAVFTIDSVWKDLKIKELSQGNLWKLPFLLSLCILLLLFQSHSKLREEEKRRHRENMEDFPLIVHLLTLYMGAGLSFSSAVERIAEDYDKPESFHTHRYAFDQIMVMNRCLHMGIRPGEVCLEWGEHFCERSYAKFAMLLSQSFSKGSRELRAMMEQEQQEAFQLQIDQVRREGEEASTRLLFPMIVLLFIIMVLVMFPAMMQFYEI